MTPQDPLAPLEHHDGYVRLFTDVTLWQPYVLEVCRRHGLAPCEPVRPTLPGTCPTFIAGDRWVIKFFGRLFEGATALAAERECYRLLSGQPLPLPALVASGDLRRAAAGWPWPYLIYEYVPGVSIGEVWAEVCFADRLALARQLGEATRRLHALPLTGSPVFRPAPDAYAALLEAQRPGCRRRHEAWRALPDPLPAQIEDYLLPTEALIGWGAGPHLIHADLNADHVLGRFEGGRWQTLALIDWGDAMVGDLLYELAALHLGLFRGDRRLLRAYLDAYGLPAGARRSLPRAALSVALLHRFNVFEACAACPQVRRAASLEELAALLWGEA